VVVRLDSLEARVLVAGGLPIGFLGLWCHIVAEAVGGCHKLVVGGIGDARFGYVVEVGVDWRYFGGAATQTEVVASVPIDGGSRLCTGAL
jgi:hypothetical protein